MPVPVSGDPPVRTVPWLISPGMVWSKPAKIERAAAATVNAEFGLKVFGAPARNVPAVTFVAPL